MGRITTAVSILFSTLIPSPVSGASVATVSTPGPSSSSSSSSESDFPLSKSNPSLLEPIVKRHVGILPPHVCKTLIALGEAEGFEIDEESIDADEDTKYQVSSQSIEVYERAFRNDGVITPAIWEALEPWIPTLTELVKQSIDKTTDEIYFPNKSDRVPQLGWVFFRKYSPDSDRKSLKLHVDSNMHTLNIALNHNFQGGGLFYVKPPSDQEEETYDDRPDIPLRYKNYNWLNTVERKNTSDIVFPMMEEGDVLIHNFTVWHAVAPIEVGVRYSFVLFYDMDNPAIQSDFESYEEVKGGGGDDDDDDYVIPVTFYHEIENVEIDLAFLDKSAEDDDEWLLMIEEKMPPFVKVELDSYEGHIFHSLISGTDQIVSTYVVRDDQQLYTIELKDDVINNDEF